MNTVSKSFLIFSMLTGLAFATPSFADEQPTASESLGLVLKAVNIAIVVSVSFAVTAYMTVRLAKRLCDPREEINNSPRYLDFDQTLVRLRIPLVNPELYNHAVV